MGLVQIWTLGDGWIDDKWTDSPVFYRTLSPLGLLPYFHSTPTPTSPFNRHQLKQGHGTDAHILPVGVWFYHWRGEGL